MRAFVIVAIVAGVGLASAAEIYRWVDDQGKTHISDRPPPTPPKNMTRQDSREYEISPDWQRDAAQRAAKDRERARALEESRVRAQQAEAAKVAASAAAQPAPARAASTGCQAQWEAFHRSADCFGPFRTANGSTKAEGYAACGAPVPDPSYECGPGPRVTPRFAP